MNRFRPIDILSAGELLIDLISTKFADSLEDISDFERLPGGSPANLCMNMARLGNVSKLVASVGNDDMGEYLFNFVKDLSVDCSAISKVTKPTTLILVTRSKEVANFEAYRGADCQISNRQIPNTILPKVSIFHTTCFGLSKKPAQSTILKKAIQAAKVGCQLSIDANYAPKIWPNRTEAQQIISQYCSLGAFVKISEVDWERLYEKPLKDPRVAIQHFLDLGANEVCVTLGGEGCLAANNVEEVFLPARKMEVKDTTGAGDSFWSGYLTAWLDGHDLEKRLLAGRRMAELKIGMVGPLPNQIDKSVIYANFQVEGT